MNKIDRKAEITEAYQCLEFLRKYYQAKINTAKETIEHSEQMLTGLRQISKVVEGAKFNESAQSNYIS